MKLKNLLTFGRDNESRRLAWLKVTLATLPEGQRLLDAGAGECRNLVYCKHLRYVSQDFCQYEGKGDGVALQTGAWDTTRIDIVSDITAIPEADGSFDVVLCTEVLEHVPDPALAVRELSRLVREGGKLIITAPFCSLTHFAPFHFATGLSRYWYERHLGELGFRSIQLTPNGGWADYMAQEIWRLPRIGQMYASALVGWSALVCAMPVLLLLRVIKAMDRGSNELLAFGWFVVAVKGSAAQAEARQ